MVPTRARVSSLLEWVAAVAGITGLAAVGSVLVRDLRTVSAVAPVIVILPWLAAIRLPDATPGSPIRLPGAPSMRTPCTALGIR